MSGLCNSEIEGFNQGGKKMTNEEFARFLIREIENHKKAVCEGQAGLGNVAYGQAHEHIIELISLYVNNMDIVEQIVKEERDGE